MGSGLRQGSWLQLTVQAAPRSVDPNTVPLGTSLELGCHTPDPRPGSGHLLVGLAALGTQPLHPQGLQPSSPSLPPSRPVLAPLSPAKWGARRGAPLPHGPRPPPDAPAHRLPAPRRRGSRRWRLSRPGSPGLRRGAPRPPAGPAGRWGLLGAARPSRPLPAPPGAALLPCGLRSVLRAGPAGRGAQLAARPGCRKCQRTDPTARGGARERPREEAGGRARRPQNPGGSALERRPGDPGARPRRHQRSAFPRPSGGSSGPQLTCGPGGDAAPKAWRGG